MVLAAVLAIAALWALVRSEDRAAAQRLTSGRRSGRCHGDAATRCQGARAAVSDPPSRG
jgi:hypothetical protein